MTHASPPSLNPDLAARISQLEVRARQIVEGLIAGRHRSPYRGSSVEFAQHREYAPGDDFRHLDWKVWARNDRYYVKQFEEETDLRATMLLDASESMSYGVGTARKYEYASQLVAALSYLLLRQFDSVGLITFDNEIRSDISPRNARNHLRTILQSLGDCSPDRKTDVGPLFRTLSERLTRRGMVILISDLLLPPDTLARGLRQMRRRRHDVIVMHVMHADEIDFRFDGLTRFDGLESTTYLTCDPRALRDDYLRALDRHLVAVRHLCAASGVDYHLVRTSDAPEAVIARLLQAKDRT